MTSGKTLWSIAPVSVPALQRERYDGIVGAMDSAGLDALVVLGGAGLGRTGNLRYVSNYAPVSRYAGVVIPRAGDPVLFVPFAVHRAWAENVTWIDDVRLSDDFARDIAGFLADCGHSSGRIGLVGHEVLCDLAEALGARVPRATLVNAASSLTQLRLVTGPVELGLARWSAAAADRVFEAAAQLIADGAREVEIVAAGESQLRRMHAEGCLLLIDSAGRQIAPLPSFRTVQPGDLVQYSVEPVSPCGHWVQSVRMFARGEPPPPIRRVLSTMQEALAVAQSMLRPGTPARAVGTAIADLLAPLAPTGQAPYGHGIGLDNFEPPVVTTDSPVVLESNMVVVLHPGVEVDGRNYYLGDTFLVTPEGGERLGAYPLELTVL